MEEERKIEKWLRSYAKKRRGHAKDSFDLHPATRRLLQGEVARQAPTSEKDDNSPSFWEMLRRQWIWLLAVTACIFLVAAIFMPVVYQAKKRAEHTLGMAQLKQVGVAMQLSAANNHGRLPASLDELTNGYLAKEDLTDRESGKPIVYTGAGKNLQSLSSNTVLAYSPENKDTRDVLFADGQTKLVDRKKFEEVTKQDLSQAVAMNNSAPLRASASIERESANPGNEPAPAIAPQPEAPTPEASTMSEPSSVPPPPSPTVAQAEVAPEPPTANGTPSAPTQIPEASSMAATPEEQPQPTSASSDLAMNSPSTQPTMTPPAVVAGETFATVPVHRASESPVNELAVEQNAFQNSIAPPQSVPVLSNFQVQQNGKSLRIVDQDGSVYVGSWRLAGRTTDDVTVNQRALQNSDKLNGAKTPVGALADNLQAAQNYFFRVRGMNRTLKQSVVFTGSLLGDYALAGKMQQSFGGMGGASYSNAPQVKSALTNQTAQLPWSNLRIAGTAVINRTNHIEVNAAPVIQPKQN